MYSVQISIMRDLIYGAVSHGASLQGLCEGMGISPNDLNNAEAHMNWEVASKFWPLAVEMTDDEQLGMHMGQEIGHTAFGMLGFLAQSCKTVEESLNSIVRFNNTISSMFHYSLVLDNDYAYMCFEAAPVFLATSPESARQATEVSVSAFKRRLGTLTGKKITPQWVEIAYEKRSPEEYERILQAPVRFNTTRSCLVLKRSDLQAPIVSYDKSLFSLFNTILTNRQNTLTGNNSLSENIRSMILFDFKGQAPAVEIIATQLSLTTRTLQRKLADENTTYREICHELRRDLTTEMLQHNLKKEQVATLLGYADASTLRRQYKSWTSATKEVAINA